MRVLRLLTRPNIGGPMRQAVALWHEHRRLGLRTVLAVGACGADEASVDLEGTGIPLLAPGDVRRQGPAAEGLVVVPSLRRGVHALRDQRAARELRRLVDAFGPDLVHTHTSKAGWLGRWAASRARVAAVAHTYHGHVLRDYFAAPAEMALRRVESFLARRTDLLFAVSPSCAAELAELGVHNVRVVPPAVDVRAFTQTSRAEARQRLGLDEAAFAAGFVGRLVSIKQPGLFFDAVQRLPGVEGYVFGDGPLRRALEPRARGRVHMLGVRDDIPRLLAGLDVLVISSRREGCPLAAVEAFAAGVPVIGFDVPGVRDALGLWGAGVLVPPTEGADGLARAVQLLVADRQRRERIVARARARLDRFGPARVARLLADGYREVLASRGRTVAAEASS